LDADRGRKRARALSLNRALIHRAFPDPLPDDRTAMRLLSDAEIAASLERALAERPEAESDLWLFAYGSLMWKPELEFAEMRLATLHGWHRRFCLWQWRYRGTRERPGLMLALDRGGACRGMIYRVVGPGLRGKVAGVWRREMIGNGYRPRWVTAMAGTDRFPAIAFVANRDGERYAGAVLDEEIASFIAGACGHVGPNAEYLLETVTRCEELGIHDPGLWRLQELVAARIIATTATQPSITPRA
jgi:glutathione-specific gamma-glutamylcyclotransferase